jgi:DsbC/DsbD-like thiol-disulfide interchange protein
MLIRNSWLACALCVAAFGAENPVAWTAAASAKSAAAGSTIRVKLTAEIQPGWHLYSLDQPPGGPNATEIWVGDGQPFEAAGDVKAPKPHVIFDPNFSMQVGLYTGRTEFEVPVKVAAGTSSGRHAVAIDARYQCCSDRLCLPPRTITAQADVEVK